TQVFSANAEIDLYDGKIGTDVSLSNYDVNLFSGKDADENLGYAARIFGYKTFRTDTWRGMPSFELRHISSRFHVLDRINSLEFANDFNLAQEFSQITQNQIKFGFN